MRQTWVHWVVAWAALASCACGTKDNGKAGADPPDPTEQDECPYRGDYEDCEPVSPACSRAHALCQDVTPHKLGPCICESPSLTSIPLTDGFARGVPAGAFGGDRFYWVEYGYMGGAPYTSKIAAGPIGKPGTILVDHITSQVSSLRVTSDALYARINEGPLAFSLDGTPLPEPTIEEAFPAVPPGRVSLDWETSVLYVDGQQVTEGIVTFVETTEGYYFAGSWFVDFRSFADPNTSQSIASGEGITDIWVSGNHFYVGSEPAGTQALLEYADLSVIGTTQ